MAVNKYRLYCTDCAAYKYVWSETAPTTCPENTGHAIDAGSIVVVATAGEPLYDEHGAMIVTQEGQAKATPPVLQRRKHTGTAGQLTTIDIEVLEDGHLYGIDYEIDNIADVHQNDYIEASVVDKDDVLGLFTGLGYTVGVDVLEVSKFLKTEYISEKADFLRGIFGAINLTDGLYIRIQYNSSGATDIGFKTRILTTE